MGIDAGTPPGLWERVRKIAAEEVAKFMRSGFLRNASITGGGLTIRDGGRFSVRHPESAGGGAAVYVGDLVDEDSGVYVGTGLLMQNPDGTDIATFRTNASSGSSLAALFSPTGEPGEVVQVIASDRFGVGMARPFVGGGFAPARYQDWGVATSSDTFETLWEQRVRKQHARLEVAIRAATTAADTTGEVRVLVDGVQLDGVSTEGFALGYTYFGPEPIDGAHLGGVVVEIQGRVTGGTGQLRVEPRYWSGYEG